jgi:hypothetical protein
MIYKVNGTTPEYRNGTMTNKRQLTSGLCVFLASLVSSGALAEVSSGALAEDPERRLFQPEDIHRIKDVGDIAISPDGEWVAYGVESTNVDKDETSSDLFMVNWDGSTRIQLTHTEDSSEGSPGFSPDGKYLAFITTLD